ncbi:MraY family glycosyltransferase [Conexibacter sp. JD483]|uniref:glycosyltransferase family 4 protein n=1 Tax=unclassified Conexibacter TaxID=2627773 RepID=UPI0027173647|nr:MULTISPECIES: MraY family glycosyltransferase [unclassified Conexibacter]MDO8186756.1 MraY family glycosyltransferase [Conexibacter sp. CPCC 205706]MDO8199042.1 MraY family glycosyltransferase [Conexibacter sp. CPCC 205762]MDR9368494.1 MraY family glycosyltransferase [Conexibacter sp. JD483]
MNELDAVFAFVVALAVAAVTTPFVAKLAMRIGAVDEPRERGLASRVTPLLGGLAILAGVLVASAIWLPITEETRGILLGAALIAAVGAIDDVVELAPQWKLLGQIVAAVIPVAAGVKVGNITFPFLGALDFGAAGGVLTVLGLVALMNVVNFSDGVDGLAAGVCAISAVAFSIIAFDLGRTGAGVLAAIVAGAALGFLIHNFHPASIFMGDCGALLLGFLLGCVAIQGSLKTNALIALVGPLAILAVPFLDTSFVVARRLKYGRAPWSADAQHFHHRFSRIGFSQRRTVLYLYAWTVLLAGLAVAIRFIPYTDNHGSFNLGWTLVIAALLLFVLGASIYLVMVLEILKLKRLRSWQMRRADPETTEHEIDVSVGRELETGEFEAVRQRTAP